VNTLAHPTNLRSPAIGVADQTLALNTTGFDRLPGGLAGVLAPIGAELRRSHRLQQVAALRAEFYRLARGYIATAFRRLGWKPLPGERFQTQELIDRLGVVAQHGRLFGRLLNIAAEDGWLLWDRSAGKVLRPPAHVDVRAERDSLLERHPDF